MNTSAKYQGNWTETVGGVVRTRFCGQIDRQADCLRGIIRMCIYKRMKIKISKLPFITSLKTSSIPAALYL